MQLRLPNRHPGMSNVIPKPKQFLQSLVESIDT